MPSGREKGVLNLNKRKLLSLIRDDIGRNYHPVLELARIAMDEENPIELRATCHHRVAEFVTPKLKAVEINDNRKTTVDINVKVEQIREALNVAGVDYDALRGIMRRPAQIEDNKVQ